MLDAINVEFSTAAVFCGATTADIGTLDKSASEPVFCAERMSATPHSRASLSWAVSSSIFALKVFFFALSLSWVANTQLDYWTKRLVRTQLIM